MTYEALCAEILEGMKAPIPTACNRSLNCRRAGGCPECQSPPGFVPHPEGKRTLYCAMAGGCMQCQKSPSLVHMEPSNVMEKMRRAGYDTTPTMTDDPFFIEVFRRMGAERTDLSRPESKKAS